MEEILVIFVCLCGAYVMSEIFRKFFLPPVLGQILAGFMMSIAVYNGILNEADFGLVNSLGQIGIVFMLFFVGMSIDWKRCMRSSKQSGWIAITSFALSFLLAFFVSIALKMSTINAIVIGISLAISAEAVTVEILERLKLIKRKISIVIIEAGIMDDTLGVLCIAFLAAFLGSKAATSVLGAFENVFIPMLLFAGIITFVRFILFPFIWRYVEREHSVVSEFTVAIITVLLIVIIADVSNVSAMLGAILAGFIVKQALVHMGKQGINEERDIERLIETITFGFFAPFFFIYIGLKTNVGYLLANPSLGILLAVIATIGKVGGSLLGNSLAGKKLKEGIVIGWAMNNRGAIGLIIAGVALSSGLISESVFTALVLMAFITTIISPVIFSYYLKKYHVKQK